MSAAAAAAKGKKKKSSLKKPPPTEAQALLGVNVPKDRANAAWGEVHTAEGKTKRKFQVCLTPEQLQEFDPETQISDDATICLFGKRRTGKSFAGRWICWCRRKNFPNYLVMSKTKVNGYWQQYIPEKYILDDWEPEVVDRLIARQMWLRCHPECKVDPRVCIILDDIVADEKLKYDRRMRELFYYGRHLYISIIVMSQYIKGLNSGVRANTDIVVIFYQGQRLQREAAAEEFGDIIEKDEFLCLLDSITTTTENGALVVDLSKPGKPASEVMYRFKAQEPPVDKFVLGSLEFVENGLKGI